MTIRYLRSSDYARTPWKNGLGFTDQIAIHPAGADLRRGDFVWRLSSARIERASPFSPFPRHDRVLVILSGAGVRLTHTFEEGDEPEVVEVAPMEPYEFPGDVPTHCELADGPVVDLSVFFAKGLDAQVEVLELGPGENLSIPFDASTGFVFVARGSVRWSSAEVSPGDCLRIDGDGVVELEAASAARLLCVRLDGV